MTPEQTDELVSKLLSRWEDRGKIRARKLAKDTRDLDDQDAYAVFEAYVRTLSEECVRIRTYAESLDKLRALDKSKAN